MNYSNMMICVFITLVVAIISASVMIPKLKGEKGHKVFDLAPKSHQKKSGTPSFGGFIFLISFLIGTGVAVLNTKFFKFQPSTLATVFVATFGFAAIGFVDDFIKFKKRHNDGFSFIAKFIVQILISFLIVFILNYYNVINTEVSLFIFKIKLNIIIYFIFLVLFFTSVANATNFTDGLDGLLTTNAIITTATLMYFAWTQHKLDLMYLDGIFLVSLIGFLIFNKYPAKIFMGDTGSMAIGGFIAINAIILKVEFLFIIYGFVYLFETLSVAMQMTYFKYTKKKTGVGKRIFPMTPIHHSFEKALNWKENTIVATFAATTLVLSLISILLYNLGVK